MAASFHLSGLTPPGQASRRQWGQQQGFGLTELLVSQTLALLLGAMLLGLLAQMALHHTESAQLAAAQRHFQAVTARLLLDLRRAGHHRSPGSWTWIETSAQRATWNYETLSPRPAGATGPQSSEAGGIRISNGVLQMQFGQGNWQALSDPALLWFEGLDLSASPRGICPARSGVISVQARPVVRGRRGPVWPWSSRVDWPSRPGLRRDTAVVCPAQTGDSP